MSASDPYAISQLHTDPARDAADQGIRQVTIRPLDTLRRGWELLGDQYWMFLVAVLIMLILAVVGPMGILAAPLSVGLFLCLIERERGGPIALGTLFQGFNQFIDSLVVVLISLAVSLIVFMPIAFVMGALVIFTSLATPDTQPALGLVMTVVLVFASAIMLASLLVYIPFVFAYQLIADRQLTGLEAVKLSFRGAWLNLGGLLWYMLVVGFLSIILVCMCYLPAILFMPISIASLFVVYRDVFQEPIVDAQLVQEI